MKKCNKCKVEQSLSEFVKNKSMKDGLHHYCKSCEKERNLKRREQRTLSTRLSRHNNPDKTLADSRKYNTPRYARHGLDLDEWITLQEAGCEICGATDKRMVVDHDHNHCPGVYGCKECIRGGLCHTCNSGIGFLKDDVELIAKALSFLQLNNKRYHQ